jgi:hypothetical protein
VTSTKAVPLLVRQLQHQREHRVGGARSRLPVGSSASTQAGRVTSARAMATRWRSPPDSCAGRCATRSAAHLRQHLRAPALRAATRRSRRMRSGIATLSSALNSGSRWWNW